MNILAAAGVEPAFTLTRKDGSRAVNIETQLWRNGGTTILALQREPGEAAAERVLLTLRKAARVYDLRAGILRGTAESLELTIDPVAPTLLALSAGSGIGSRNRGRVRRRRRRNSNDHLQPAAGRGLRRGSASRRAGRSARRSRSGPLGERPLARRAGREAIRLRYGRCPREMADPRDERADWQQRVERSRACCWD